MKTFLTSDTHFYHENIIRFCDRPFSNSNEMNEAIINNWNSVVSKDDIVYHLGDFCFVRGGKDNIERVLKNLLFRLNGKIIIVCGNHDGNLDRFDHLFYEYHPRNIILERDIEGQIVQLSHYPMLSWNKKSHGALHFFGHIHSGKKEVLCQNGSCDVGVDFWSFSPVLFEKAREESLSDKGKLNRNKGY